MRIFYHINLTQHNPDSDIVSFAFVDDRGHSLYAELVDHKTLTSSVLASKQLVGKKGFKTITENVAHSVCVQGGISMLRDRLGSFMSQYSKGSVTLIGRSNYWEMQALLWLLRWEGIDNQIGIIHISKNIYEEYWNELHREVLTFLPETNALRKSKTYKHIARKIERQSTK